LNQCGIETWLVCRRAWTDARPFNWTSVVLKLEKGSLRRKPRIELLIEPVWYWNSPDLSTYYMRLQTFNWTSVVLKRSWGKIRSCPHTWPFNWTSVVLKPPHGRSRAGGRAWLLIEPVWYWNITIAFRASYLAELLIEPVWYWNSRRSPQP